MEFYTRFERALEHQKHKELKADCDTIYTKPLMKLGNSLEKHMGETYTSKLLSFSRSGFQKFMSIVEQIK